MTLIFLALRRAGADLLRPRMLALMALPMVAALLVWGGLAWGFGAGWVAGLTGLWAGVALPDWLGGAQVGLAEALAYGAVILGVVSAVYVTALLITAVFFMPVLVEWVSREHFPGLARLKGGTFIGGLVNSLVALAVYGVLWLITLPFWLLGPLGVVASLVLNAWLNQRLFLYDALAEHASGPELRLLRQRGDWPLYVLSALLALLHFVPIVNFVAPVFMALALTHFCLARLEELRLASAT